MSHPVTRTGKETQGTKKRASTPQPSVDDSDSDTEMGEDGKSSDSGDSELRIVEARGSVDIEETGLQEESDEQELGKY